jgi:hypothetical protein
MGAVPRLRESDKLRLGLGGELEKRIPLDKVRNNLFQIRDDNKWVPPYIKPYHVSLVSSPLSPISSEALVRILQTTSCSDGNSNRCMVCKRAFPSKVVRFRV